MDTERREGTVRMRKPLPLLDQIDTMRMYLRTLQADIRRASRDESSHYLRRRVSPFVVSLRYARLSRAYELEEVAQECLKQLRQAHALSIAEFFPGDHIRMEMVIKEHPRSPERFVVNDVEWSRVNGYHYVAWQLTRTGDLFKRGPNWLCPSRHIIIERCDAPLSEKTQRQCAYFRDRARDFANNVLERGKIEKIIEQVRERRARRGY